uniref:Uncharacterized protein n=1 Tax=viral metagenome TaxID=1070528 RepID=A0A6H1ZQ63_9ZZZZ
MKQSQIIEQYLVSLEGQWLERNELSNLETSFGFLPPRVERTIRGMLEQNKTDQMVGKEPTYKIEQKIEEKNGKPIAWVRAVPPERYEIYKVEGIEVDRVPVWS